jgi:hypothetical protein
MQLSGLFRKLAAGIVSAVLLASCAEVVSGDANRVRIDTSDLGTIAPGTREWLSLLRARDHCAAYAKSAELVDLRGSIAIYDCVAHK